MRQLGQDFSAGVKGEAASTETRLHAPPSSQLQPQAIRGPEGNSHTGDVDQLLTSSCAQQRHDKTILHKSKLNSQNLEQLP